MPQLTVGQAIKELQKEDPKAKLVLAGDPEGNYYYPVDEVGGDFVLDSHGEIHSTDDEECPKGKKAVVLWPRHWESS